MAVDEKVSVQKSRKQRIGLGLRLPAVASLLFLIAACGFFIYVLLHPIW